MHKDKWNRRHQEHPSDHRPATPSPILVRTLEELEPGKALDLAAGKGRNALFLARQGWDTTAVDFSEIAVHAGSQLSTELDLPVSWEVQDLTEYTPAADAYDLVCMFYLHLPWKQLQVVIQKAARATKPGGKLLVVGPDRSNLEQGAGGPRDPEVLYSPQDIVPLLHEFEIVRAETERNPVDHGHSGAGGTQVDCVVLATRNG